MAKSIKSLIDKDKKLKNDRISKPRNLHLKDTIKLSPLGRAKLSLCYLLLGLWALIILVPVSLIVVGAFNVANPNRLTFDTFIFGFDNFEALFTTERIYFVEWMSNSLLISIITMIATVVVVSLTGYAYSRFRFKGKKLSLMIVMLIQMAPSTLALIAFYIINQLIVQTTGLFPFITLIIIYTGGSISGNTFVLKGYLDSISTEIDDSAKIDGCNNFKTYLRMIMPIARPMLSIIALWSFIGPFGDVILPRILLISPQSFTLPVGLFSLLQLDGQQQIYEPQYAAGALLTAIPVAGVFMYSQKHMISGLSAGGVKG